MKVSAFQVVYNFLKIRLLKQSGLKKFGTKTPGTALEKSKFSKHQKFPSYEDFELRGWHRLRTFPTSACSATPDCRIEECLKYWLTVGGKGNWFLFPRPRISLFLFVINILSETYNFYLSNVKIAQLQIFWLVAHFFEILELHFFFDHKIMEQSLGIARPLQLYESLK